MKARKTSTKIALSFLLAALVVSMSPGLVQAQELGSKSISDEVVRLKGTESFYYIGKDGNKYAFPDLKVLASWYKDASEFLVASEEVLSQYPTARNIGFRPGTKLVKENVASDKIYAVEPGSVLRWITDAEIFIGLGYKPRLVAEVDPATMVTYTAGPDIEAVVHPTGALVKHGTGLGNVYYIDNGTKRLVTNDAFVANRFQHRFVLKIDESIQYPDGEPITGYEEELSNPVLTSEPELPDLVALDIELIETPDNHISAKFLVKNDSSIAITKEFYISFEGRTPDGGGATGLPTYAGEFAPGEVKEFSPISFAHIHDGTYTFIMDVDPREQIDESDESNNYLEKDFIVSGDYDLEATEIYATDMPDGTKEVKAVVTNNSAVTLTQDFSIELRSSFSAPGSPTSGGPVEIFLETYDFAPGEQKEYDLGSVGLEDGKYIFDIKVDYWDVIEEVDEENNYLREQYHVGPVEPGQVQVGHLGPVARTMSTGSVDNQMLNFSVKPTNEIRIEKVRLSVASKLSGTTEAAGATNYSYIQNIKIVDLYSGETLVGPEDTAFSLFDGFDSTYGHYEEIILDEPFTIEAGEIRYFSFQVDVHEYYDTMSGNSILVRVDLDGTSYVYDVDAQEYLSVSQIIPGSLVSNMMPVEAPSLLVGKMETASPVEVVKGVGNVLGLGALLTAGAVDDITLNSLKVRVYADNDGEFDSGGYGDTAANGIVETVSLYEHTVTGDERIAGPRNIILSSGSAYYPGTNYYMAEFSGIGLEIPAGEQRVLYAKANIKSTVTSTYYVAFDIVPFEDIGVESSLGYVHPTSMFYHLNLATIPVPVVTVYTRGELSVAVDADTPDSDVVVSGSTDVELTKIRFNAVREDMVVTGLELVTEDPGSIDLVTLSYTDTSGSTATQTVSFNESGIAALTYGQVEIYCQKDRDSIMTISASLKTITDGAISGDMPKISLRKVGSQFGPADKLTNDFIAVGVSSDATLYGLVDRIMLDDSQVNAMTVRKTKVTASAESLPNPYGSITSQENVAIFKLNSTPEAGSSQNSILEGLAITLNGSAIDAGMAGDATMSLYKGSTFSSANLIGQATSTGIMAQSRTFTFVDSDIVDNNEWDGDLRVYVVADTTDTTPFTPSANDTLSATLDTWTWDDGEVSYATPVAGYPVSGGYGLTF